jgi:hypothetical protein
VASQDHFSTLFRADCYFQLRALRGVNPLAERQTRFHSQYYLFGLLNRRGPAKPKLTVYVE